MISTRKIIILFTCLLVTVSAVAQQDTLLNREVEVIKEYQPSISDAYKIIGNPKINDNQSYTPTFEYRIKSVPKVNSDKSISHLPVVQLGNHPKTPQGTGYVKGGFGNAITPYAEFVFNTAPSRTTDFGFQLSHFSSQPNILLTNTIKTEAPYSTSMARFFVKNYFKKAVLDWEVKYNRDRITYYGFPGTDTTLYNAMLNQADYVNVKQVFNNASTTFKLVNLNARSNLHYDMSLYYNYFWNSTEAIEHSAKLNANFISKKRNYEIVTETKIEFIHASGLKNPYTQDSTHTYFIAGVSPYVVFKKNKNWQLSAGINLGMLIDNDTSATIHVSPKVHFDYHPIQGIITLFAGADGGLIANNYSVATASNQYLNEYAELEASQRVVNVYGGFRGKISRKISYLADVDFSVNKNMPYFNLINDQTVSILTFDNRFNTNYYDTNVLRFGAKLHYSGNSLLLTLNGNFYNATTNDTDVLPHQPKFDASFNLQYKLNEDLSLNADVNYIGGRQAVIETIKIASTPTLEYFDLKDILNVNIGADYQFTKKIKFFVDAKNILNQNYEVWHGYNSQGILIMLGGSYAF